MVNGRENFCIQARMGIIITQERDKKMRPNISKNNFSKRSDKNLRWICGSEKVFPRNID